MIEYQITIPRGDTYSFTVNRKTKTGEIVPFIDGDLVTFTLRSASDKLIFAHEYNAFPADGAVMVLIEHEDTASLTLGKYKYDLRHKTIDGKVHTLIKNSPFVLVEEETRYE